MIVIDWDPNATQLHPDNTFHVARWMGNDDDTQLFDLISFLKSTVYRVSVKHWFRDNIFTNLYL